MRVTCPRSKSPRPQPLRQRRQHDRTGELPLAVSLPLFDDSAASLARQALEAEYEKKEKCGLFGVWGTREASQVTYQGLFAQQHRGQESAGIVATNGTNLEGHAGMGLVSQVFNPRMLREELA